MPAFYEIRVREFLHADEDQIVGRLSGITRQGMSELSASQLEAWRSQIPILRKALSHDCAHNWHLLLEFAMPRRGKRIDAVLLTGNVVQVLEFKNGAKHYQRDAIAQVEDYCLDLRDFHRVSRETVLVPILVATLAKEADFPADPPFDFVAPVWRSSAQGLGDVLQHAFVRYGGRDSTKHPESWNRSEYLPTPTIIEAAQLLYETHSVQEVTRSHAGAENLTRTGDAVSRAIDTARREGQKVICFITGVPGAGKTLAGLNVIHSRQRQDGALGAFLSGNGPLVRVLSEALARDHSLRTDETLEESRRMVSAFIQNVHRFIDGHYTSTDAPPDRLVVFDEAQRAWNAQHSNRKFKRNISEPEIMLDIMNRHERWAVIVALVGSGQEINTGEAGLREWGRALTQRFSDWKVFISGELAINRAGGSSLFEAHPKGLHIIESPALHLDVSIRSYKAQAVSDFVAHLLLFEIEAARDALAKCSEFPIGVTREFDEAKKWLRRRQRGTRRIGLVASSGGRRLRAHGLDVRTELDVENWFLNGPDDVRSSHYLETPATEFGIQGLEVDWSGVCWDLDLVPENKDWCVGAFKGTRWQKVNDSIRRQYVINKHRVLLTRAREGLVIWVPQGDPTDWTRPVERYDLIARHLTACGVQHL